MKSAWRAGALIGVLIGGLCLVSGARAQVSTSAPDATQGASPLDAIAQGRPIIEARLRYEGVDQANFSRSAEAQTLRSRLGWQTGAWDNLKGLVEIENVSHFGGDHFNDTVNHRTAYPGVNDPDVTEINRLQLAWTPSRDFQAVVGRQRLTLDDLRFIGDSNWRQDEQTFDAARLDASLGRFSATYAYIGKVDRTLGQSADYTSDSHVLNAYLSVAEALRIEGFVYALRLNQAPASSTETTGARITGQMPVSALTISYAAAYAVQTDDANNPGRYRVPYTMAELAGAWSLYTARINYESLGSDGKHGFGTPLASLHGFQGWADAFTTTPARGIDDLNLSLAVAAPIRWKYLSQVQLFVRHHDFSYAQAGRPDDLGSEWDLSAQGAVTPKLAALVKWADYHGTLASPGRRKLWFQLEYHY